MRYESATVPAAVMPDHASRDDGFKKTCHCSPAGGWEGFLKPGQVRRPAKHYIFKAFGKKSIESQNDSHLF